MECTCSVASVKLQCMTAHSRQCFFRLSADFRLLSVHPPEISTKSEQCRGSVPCSLQGIVYCVCSVHSSYTMDCSVPSVCTALHCRYTPLRSGFVSLQKDAEYGHPKGHVRVSMAPNSDGILVVCIIFHEK